MNNLPQGWEKVPVTEIVALHDARRVPLNAAQRAEMKGPIPYYGANGLVDYVNDYLFDGDYVLLAEDGGYFDDPRRGVAYEASGKFWVNNHAHILQPLGGISTRFLRHQLNATNWLPYVGGSTRPKLTQRGLQQAQVPVPPLPEQQRIMAKMDSLTGKSRRARDHLDHIPRLVEKYKQAILDAAFDGRLTKLKSHQLTFVELGALLQFGPQNGLYLPKDRYGSGAPILRIQNYGLDSVDPIDTWSRVNVPEKMASQYSLSCGDLVINRVNSPSHLGKSMVVVADMGGALFESNMMRMRLRPGVEPRFVQLYLSSPKGRAALTKGAKWAVNQASINQGDVTGTLLPIPDHDAQIEIVQRIRQAFAWVNRLATATTSARKLIDHLDQAVLAKAFKGELLPQDLADEPASVLLDRIRAERAAAPKAKRSRKKTA